ncbi:tetratricopeptide repeat protein [Flavobacterium sp. J27]|uniref:tetratricopeptide repeat protein n=1 Tax=Flavobacterium sp. J27 TaxID=2060419 RepID=UPI001030BC8B|nr:tetratricopeptide repeat protein [Flavobacterium sp. J27]
MKILFSKIIVFFFICFQVSFSQLLSEFDLDSAYRNELLVENNALKQRISRFPSEAKSINAAIAQFIRQKDYNNALEQANQLNQILPNNADVKCFQAKMYYKLNNTELAIQLYNQAIQLNPNNKWFYINKAGLLSEMNHISEAIETVDTLIKIHKDWSIAYNLKASLLLHENKKQQALSVFNQAIQLSPKSALIYTNRGDLFLEMNDKENAILNYQKALEIQPDYLSAKLKLDTIRLN